MPPFHDLSGQQFGALQVEARIDTEPRHVHWRCRCDCGGMVVVQGSNLKNGHTTSCGCARRELMRAKQLTHGQSKTRVYGIWAGMWTRCTNEKHGDFHRYGGRGITVCDRWQSFERFYQDMGDPPAKAWIDRIDNEGPYEPGNCRWATAKQQQRNKRNNHLVTFNDKTQTVTEWGEERGMKPLTLLQRLRYGWSVERALTEPVNVGWTIQSWQKG